MKAAGFIGCAVLALTTFRAFGADGITVAVTLRVVRYQARAPIASELVERLHAHLIDEGVAFTAGEAPAPTPPPRPPAPPAPLGIKLR